MHASELIDTAIIKHIAPFLKLAGFRKKAHNFWRDAGHVIDVITIQKSQWNDAADAQFAVNLGLYWPRVQNAIGNTARGTPPREYDCVVRTRLGPLFDGGRDFWWKVRDEADVQAVGSDVVEKLREHGLPWLERGHDPQQALEYARRLYRAERLEAVEAAFRDCTPTA